MTPREDLGSPTAVSRTARRRSAGRAGRVRADIIMALDDALNGLTCDEIEQALNLRHQTASARIRELVLSGTAEDSGLRRPTRSGSFAIVWCLAYPLPSKGAS